MKRLSIQLRVTLWFAAGMLLLAAVAMTAVLPISETVRKGAARQRLFDLVEHNAGKVEFEFGVLDIDEDFIEYSDGVYLTAYAEDRALLAGALPPGLVLVAPFQNGELREITWENNRYYYYDRLVAHEGLPNIWVRGLVQEEKGGGTAGTLLSVALRALPGLALLAALGGYFMTRRALQPLDQLRRAAQEVSSGEDLNRRIDIGPGQDELHRLADTFNEMLARLEASFETEKQFVSDASHELRTPTAVILAQAEYALSQEDPAEYAEALESIGRQAGKMQKLIQSLLLLTRLERGMEEMPQEPVNLSALLAELCDDFSLALERDITLEAQIVPELFVNGNRELLTRLCMNLLSNAMRYGRCGGHIRVSLEAEESSAVLRVKDDGIGIAPAHLKKIWQRFYQADPARTQGSGLGLSMVQNIAKLHGGSVGCTSIEGRGSEFELRLTLIKL